MKLKAETLIKTTQSWNGDTLVVYPTGQPEITMLKFTVPPYTKLPLHYHPYINAGVVLTGELTVISEKEDTLYLKKGDPIVELVNTWHYGINETAEPTELIVFYAGIKDSAITVSQGGHH